MIGAVVRCAARRLTRMRIAFLTGIWPPDVGGPATHGPDFARFLVDARTRRPRRDDGRRRAGGAAVRGGGRLAPAAVSRSATARWRCAEHVRRGAADVVYATATYAAAAAAATAARRPLVAKLVSDPAYERARRYRPLRGHARGVPGRGDARRYERSRRLGRARCATRDDDRRAERVSRRDRRAAGASSDARLLVLTNPAPPPTRGRARAARAGHVRLRRPAHAPEGARRRDRGDRPRAGREARRRRRRPRAGRARAPGGGLRRRVPGARSSACELATRRLRIVAGAEAGLLSSDWENLPHSAVEALSVGVPVVSTAVGGVPEVVT